MQRGREGERNTQREKDNVCERECREGEGERNVERERERERNTEIQM
jgi:hypothetical protein